MSKHQDYFAKELRRQQPSYTNYPHPAFEREFKAWLEYAARSKSMFWSKPSAVVTKPSISKQMPKFRK